MGWVAAIAAAWMGLAAGTAAQADTVTIAHSTWVGYGPLYIAQEKGFFKKNGVDVDLVVMEDPKERFPTLMADRIQMIASTVDTALLYMKQPDYYKYVLAVDDSDGGDGIVCNTDITSIADLKGKQVAVSEGSVSEFYLNVLLNKAGMKESDLNIVNMTAADAGGAFVSNRVDAAVTWEPWLTKGKNRENGHLLVDSSTSPGLITDVLTVRTSWLKDHQKEVAAIVKSWNEAVAYWKANPEDGLAIMSKGVGGWLKDPAAFKDTLAGVKIYDEADNKAFFGTPDKPGPIYQTVKYAIDIWSSKGKMQVQAKPEDLIDYSFVNK
jgi:NitT/TauT family transport system substrate-binding protein